MLRWNRVANPSADRRNTTVALPEGELPVLSCDSLMERTGTRQLVAALRAKFGLPIEMFDTSAQPVLAAFAEFVQLLPASESHHHAGPGGLFTHTIEVTIFALDHRRGQILPKGAAPEVIGEQAHRWTYGVFIAALLHDVGKPIADLRVHIRKDGSTERWSPLAGSMVACGATSYQVEFAPREARDYALHTKLPVLLLNRFVPAFILGWLSEDAGLIRELFAVLAGEEAAKDGVLHQLVSRADAESVRRNLLSGSRVRFATARRVPLIEQLMQALRAMLKEGGRLPLNRSGAAGWVYGQDMWFVSKRLADEVREYLAAEEPAEGSIPRDNQRLFDTWQEYGAAVTNPRTGGAVWDVLVIGPGYEHSLTVLRFHLSVLFERTDAYPAVMQGRIEIGERIAKPSTREGGEGDAAKKRSDEPTSAAAKAEEYLEAVDERAQARTDSATGDAAQSAPMLRPAVAPAWCGPAGSGLQPGDGAPDAARRFMGWVQDGLASGRLRFNESGALVHFVPEGMLLVSPRVFREFAKVHGEDGKGAAAEESAQPGKGIQRQLLRAAWHVRADKGVNILTYNVVRGGRTVSQLSGVVIGQPARFVNPLPPTNPVLVPAAPRQGEATP